MYMFGSYNMYSRTQPCLPGRIAWYRPHGWLLEAARLVLRGGLKTRCFKDVVAERHVVFFSFFFGDRGSRRNMVPARMWTRRVAKFRLIFYYYY